MRRHLCSGSSPLLLAARTSLLVLALSLCLPAPASAASYVRYGPGVVSAGGYAVLAAAYNTSHVAFNPSAPSVSIGLSLALSLSSPSTTLDPSLVGVDQALQFAVELLNFRGGVTISGVQHYVSVAYASDDGSPTQAQAIYADLVASSNYSALLAPSSDALLQAVSAQLSSSSAFFMLAVNDVDPADYTAPAAGTRLFSQLNSVTARWTPALTAINAQAALYAASGGSGSANGIKTLCMLSSNDTLVQAAASGVRQWITAENARRGNADNITVLVDAVWSQAVTGTYEDYVAYLNLCPDGVDVMLLQDASLASLDAALALSASLLRPRAVLGIHPQNALLSGSPTAAAGWTVSLPLLGALPSTLRPLGGQFASLTDAGTALHYWATGAGQSVLASTTNAAYAYIAALDLLVAAFNQSASLAPTDLRAGLLSLNGQQSLLSPLYFSATTGLNAAPQAYTAQLLANAAAVALSPSSPLTYPWPWPRLPTRPDPLPYVTLGPGVVSAGGVAYLQQGYPLGYVARNATAPTLSIGLSLSLGVSATLAGLDTVLAYIVDAVNFRGGFNVSGVPHYLSITYATDDGSAELTKAVYADLEASGKYPLYLAPQGDELLQSLSPFLASTQTLMLSVYNADPTDFATPHTNLVSLVDTADQRWQAALSLINLYAAQNVASGGSGSANGIKTLCMLSSNDTLVQAAAAGVRQWIAAENTRRGNADNITVLVDAVWSQAVTGTYEDYVAYLNLCPDGVDVMLLQDGSVSTLDAQLALKASQLRPKAALGLDPSTSVLTNPAMAVEAAGWVYPLPGAATLQSTLPALGGKWQSLTDAVIGAHVWGMGANQSTAVPLVGYGYIAAIDVLAAALHRSASLQPSDLRAALQSLNGQNALVVPLQFSAYTGVNVAPASTVMQILQSGKTTYLANQSATVGAQRINATALSYPYDWSWPSLIRAGDVLSKAQSSALVILALVICVLGAWVAQIIVEQSIFVRRKGGWWSAWLLVVALALGGVSVWCSLLMASSALSLTKPNSADSSVHQSFAFDVALLAWLPSILLTYLGLVIMMGDVESRGMSGGSRASQAQQLLREQKEEKRKKAALSNRAHLDHLLQAVSWRAALGGVVVAAAIALTRVTLWWIWVQDASFRSEGWAWAVTTVLNVVGVPLALLMFFHALRWRIAAVFLFAACVTLDYQVQLQGLTFSYAPGLQPLPALLATADVEQSVVNLIAGIIAALICFIFIGLQFSRLKLSRNGLSVLVASLEALIHRQKEQLQAASEGAAQLRLQLTLALRLVEHINVATPIPLDYAFAMANLAQLDALQALYAPSSSSLAVPASAASKPSPVMSVVGRPSEVERLHVDARASHTASARTTPRTEDESHDSADAGDAGASLQPAKAKLPTSSVSGSAVPHSSRVAPAPDDGPEGETDGGDAGLEHCAALSSTVSAAVSVAAAAAASPRKRTPTIVTVQPTSSLSRAASSVSSTASTNRLLHTALSGASPYLHSPTSKSIASRPPPSRGAEAELLAAMEAQTQWQEGLLLAQPRASMSPTSAARKGQSFASTAPAEDTRFDLSAPLLGGGASGAPTGAAQPTLAALLSHPVCVEVVKAQLQQQHSVENLVFFLHVRRYKQVGTARLRRALAVAIVDAFIRLNAPQQVNLGTQQREAITAAVQHKGDDCPVDLFKDAEREVLQLMETNVLRAMAGTAALRQCQWVLAAVALPTSAAEVEGKEGRNAALLWREAKGSVNAGAEESSLLSVGSGQR